MINFAATACFREILSCLPERIVVVERVIEELHRDPRTGKPAPQLLIALLNDGLIERADQTDELAELEVELTGADAPDDLDDGEAATLAYAALHGVSIIVDEAKCRRICAARFQLIQMHSSVDIFRRDEVRRTLGEAAVAEAVFDALQLGRMRVSDRDLPWVIDQIGVDRARRCRSLRQDRVRALLLRREGLTRLPQSPSGDVGE